MNNILTNQFIRKIDVYPNSRILQCRKDKDDSGNAEEKYEPSPCTMIKILVWSHQNNDEIVLVTLGHTLLHSRFFACLTKVKENHIFGQGMMLAPQHQHQQTPQIFPLLSVGNIFLHYSVYSTLHFQLDTLSSCSVLVVKLFFLLFGFLMLENWIF